MTKGGQEPCNAYNANMQSRTVRSHRSCKANVWNGTVGEMHIQDWTSPAAGQCPAGSVVSRVSLHRLTDESETVISWLDASHNASSLMRNES